MTLLGFNDVNHVQCNLVIYELGKPAMYNKKTYQKLTGFYLISTKLVQKIITY
jgi:hypothetical protein